MHEVRDVRVTERKSVTMPFVAPELSPVRRVDLELERGEPGWTDLDTKVPDLTTDHLPHGLADRQLYEITVGTAIRKKTVRREVARKRPTKRRWS